MEKSAPSRFHFQSLDQKIVKTGPVLLSQLFPDFKSFDPGAGQAPLYTIRVGSVRHTSHSKEPSTSGRIHSGCTVVVHQMFVARGKISICSKRLQPVARSAEV